MNRITVALFFAFLIACTSSVLAQTTLEVDAVANKISEMVKQSHRSRASAAHMLAVLEKDVSNHKTTYEKLKQDLSKLKELLRTAETKGSVETANGGTIPVERLNVFAKQTLDKLNQSEQETSTAREIVRDCKATTADLKDAEMEAFATAKEFKEVMKTFRRKLVLQYKTLQFRKELLDSQLKAVRELKTNNTNHLNLDMAEKIRQKIRKLLSPADN